MRHTGKYEAILVLCVGDGLPLAKIAAGIGVSANTVSNYVWHLCYQGRLRKSDDKPAIYTTTGQGRIKREKSMPTMTKPTRKSTAHLAPKAKAPAWSAPNGVPLTKAKKVEAQPIITSRTKVTICPHGRDTRFEADPSIAGRGVITADWHERLKAERRRA